MDTKDIDRKIAVIFATDAVGYSKHMEKDENQTIQSFETCNEILEKLLKKYGGSVFNTAGDSVLAEFPSAVDAVECGSDFQKEIKKRNASIDTSVKLEFRIGINMGDVVKKSGNLLGDGVNIAARLEALSQSNGISISKSVFDLVSNKTNLSFNDLGVQKVKDNEFHAFDVLLDPSQKRKLKTKSNELLFTTIAVVLIIGLAGIVYYNSKVHVNENNKTVLTADKPSVLVMPFENQTGKKENDFIGMGITSNIISTLSLNEQLLIPSTNIGKFIQENNLLDKEIKEKYGIQYILRGDVQGGQGNFRVNVQMSDLSKKEMIWSKIFDFKNNNDIFDIQDKLGLSILKQLQIKFKSGGFAHNISRNPEVYKKHIYADSAFKTKTIEGTNKAEKLWREAIELEPENTRLPFMIGLIHWRKVTLGISKDSKADMKIAYDYAINAIQKNESWSTAHSLAGLIELFSGKHDVACSRIAKLIELSKTASDIATANLVIHSCGDLEAAITNYEQVFAINPHYSSWINYMYAYALTEKKDYEKAKEFCTEQLKKRHNWSGVEKTLYIVLAYIHKKQGSEKLAKEMFEIQRKKGGKSITAQQIYKGFISKKDKSFLNDIVETLKPFGLPDK
jgi:class 3 adenylate cyclase/TolB-like protein